MAGNHTVAGDALIGHSKIEAAVGDELVDLFEGPRVEQQFDALPGGELAGVVLPPQTILAAAELGAALEIGESVSRVHVAISYQPSAISTES